MIDDDKPWLAVSQVFCSLLMFIAPGIIMVYFGFTKYSSNIEIRNILYSFGGIFLVVGGLYFILAIYGVIKTIKFSLSIRRDEKSVDDIEDEALFEN